MIKNFIFLVVFLLYANSSYAQSEWVAYNPNQQPQQPVAYINYPQQVNYYANYTYPVFTPYIVYQPVVYQSYHLFKRQNTVYYPTVIWVNNYPNYYYYPK